MTTENNRLYNTQNREKRWFSVEEERIVSVGIDIGTSTLQCIFSSMVLRNLSPAFAVPRMELAEKRVLYRAPNRLTPLKTPDTIDGDAIAALIREDYRRAGIEPSQIRCGAVIITGETARKQNAREVTQSLAGLAGDFVVATAGPELESVLAGKGAGAAALSVERGKTVLNLDIGGGTTNCCLFDRGEPLHTGCLNIGGRLLRFTPSGEVLAYTDAMRLIAEDVGVALRIGEPLPKEAVLRIANRMTAVLEESANLRPRTALHAALTVGGALPDTLHADLYTFSGGVADCVYQSARGELDFDDIGETLGRCIAASRFFTEGRVLHPAETQHATVIGAGAYSMTVSGSTIALENVAFPLKGLAVGKVRLAEAADISGLAAQIRKQFDLYEPPFAIGFEGLHSPSFSQIEQIAEQIVQGLGTQSPRILIMAEDMAKALGQALLRRWGLGAAMLCLDGISLTHGDTVDLGAPLSGGRVIPVVVKTLAFGY